MARPKKEQPTPMEQEVKEFLDTTPNILNWTKKLNEPTPEQFLISKGIDPPIKESPLRLQINFHELAQLLNEFKNS